MASIWKLPVVFICENNQYAMSMPAAFAIPVQVADRAASYDMPGERVDGMDLLAVYDSVKTAVDRARRGDGPSLVEALTYRFKGHSKSDKQVYRTKDEVKAWQERDCIFRFERRLVSQGILTQIEADAIETRVQQEIAAAIAFADASPDPDPNALLNDVYFEEASNQTDRAMRGLMLDTANAVTPAHRTLPTWFSRTFATHAGSEPPRRRARAVWQRGHRAKRLRRP